MWASSIHRLPGRMQVPISLGEQAWLRMKWPKICWRASLNQVCVCSTRIIVRASRLNSVPSLEERADITKELALRSQISGTRWFWINRMEITWRLVRPSLIRLKQPWCRKTSYSWIKRGDARTAISTGSDSQSPETSCRCTKSWILAIEGHTYCANMDVEHWPPRQFVL